MEETKAYVENFKEMGRLKISTLLGWGAFLILMAYFVNGLFPELQFLLFKNSTFIPKIIFKIILISVLYMLFIIRGKLLIPKFLMFIWLIFVSYLILDTIYLVSICDYSLQYVLFSYNSYYFFVIITPLFFIAYGLITEKSFMRFLFLLSIPLIILGLAQYFLMKTIIPINNFPDAYFKVNSWDFYGKVRAFSLFSSGFRFGHFIALIASSTFAIILQNKSIFNKVKISFIFLLALFAGYATLTRNTYLEITCSLISIFLFLKFPKIRNILKVIPILYGSIGVLSIFILPQLFDNINIHSSILSPESFSMRLDEWHQYGSIWFNNIGSALLGTGYIQSSRFAITKDVVIDNIILAVGLHIGLIGLLIFLIFMWLIWMFIYKETIKNPTPLHTVIMGVFSTWIIVNLFNIVITPMMLIGLFLILIRKNKNLKAGNYCT